MKRARRWALPGAVGLAVSLTALNGLAALAHQGPASPWPGRSPKYWPPKY